MNIHMKDLIRLRSLLHDGSFGHLIEVERLQPRPLRARREAVNDLLAEAGRRYDQTTCDFIENVAQACDRRAQMEADWMLMIGLQFGKWLAKAHGASPEVVGCILAAASEVLEDQEAMDDLVHRQVADDAAAVGLTRDEFVLHRLLDRMPNEDDEHPGAGV